jgi:hypothetical protein
MDIATGQPEDHPTPLPYDPGRSPATAPPTAIVPGQLSGPTVPARDTTGEYQAPLSALESDIRGAQASGQNARNAMLAAYERGIRPLGADYGDQPQLPVVPDNAVPPSSSFLYPFSGDEPVPAAGYHGDEPG